MSAPVILLGLGFATTRLARQLAQQGREVYAIVRQPERYADLDIHLCELTPQGIPPGGVLVHTIPPVEGAEKSGIRSLIYSVNPARIIYISSTGVYGSQTQVDEKTLPAPQEEKGRARIDEEEWLTSTGIPTLILRSAAIYGPGRGIHERLKEGRLTTLPRGAGSIVSRIHVDDLAALLQAGIDADLEGAWPVADDRPAASEEILAWCAARLGIELPEIPGNTSPLTTGRSVDGRKIRELLKVKLKYPSWETGIPASE